MADFEIYVCMMRIHAPPRDFRDIPKEVAEELDFFLRKRIPSIGGKSSK